MAGSLQVLIAFFDIGESSLTPRNAKWVDVDSIEDAAAKVKTCIEENDLGHRDWFGGIVRNEKKVPVSVVQYSGRIATVEEDAQFIKNAEKLLKKR